MEEILGLKRRLFTHCKNKRDNVIVNTIKNHRKSCTCKRTLELDNKSITYLPVPEKKGINWDSRTLSGTTLDANPGLGNKGQEINPL